MNMFYGVHHCNFASAPTCQSKSFNTNSQLNSHIEHLIYDSGAPGNLDLKREKDSEIQRRILPQHVKTLQSLLKRDTTISFFKVDQLTQHYQIKK